MQNKDPSSIPIVILAGGQSQRLRVDNKYKWQLPFSGDKTLLRHIIEKAQKQSKRIAINAPYLNQDHGALEITEALGHYGLPLIHDLIPNFQGPLAGLLTSLHWAKKQQYTWVATIACDTPFFPDNLLKQFAEASLTNASAPAHLASSCDRLHPVFGLWSTTLYTPLREHIANSNSGSVVRWAQAHHASVLEMDSIPHGNHMIDPFLNINTLADYEQALRLLE